MVETAASESLPRYKELRPGILLIDTLTEGQSAGIVAELEDRSWQQSTIAQVRDFSVVEYADIHIRSALAMGVRGDDQVGQDLFAGIRTDALRVFNQYWDLNVRTTKNPQFTRYEMGHFIKIHTDTGGAYPNRIGSVVTYLTDDYVGGEICFPKFGLKIKPTAGQTLVFPSDYVHEVVPIEGGVKVIFLFFIESD